MTGRSLIVLGTGGHASVVIDLAREAGWTVTGCIGPQPPSFPRFHCAHLGGDDVLDELDPRTVAVTVGIGAIGDATLRREIFEHAVAKGFALPPISHPKATVAGSATLGAGTQVMAGAVVQPFARLGSNVIVNTSAVVEHHCEVGAHAHVAPGAVLCGGVGVGSGCHIGARATVLQGLHVGPGAVVGAGAVVVRNVPAGCTVKGCPAQ